MPRKGHKIGCQCAVCRAMERKIQPAITMGIVTFAGVRITFAEVRIGEFFNYDEQVFKKVSEQAAMNISTGGVGDASISFRPETKIEPR